MKDVDVDMRIGIIGRAAIGATLSHMATETENLTNESDQTAEI